MSSRKNSLSQSEAEEIEAIIDVEDEEIVDLTNNNNTDTLPMAALREARSGQVERPQVGYTKLNYKYLLKNTFYI